MSKLISTPTVTFGQWQINSTQVFFKSPLSFGVVNLKPILPGHVLVIPQRKTSRFAELRADEVADLWLSAQKIGQKLEEYYKCKALTMAIQDGVDAGQTVDHVHVHVIPRTKGDFENNDDIYQELDSETRKEQTEEQMNQESLIYQKLFEE